MLRQHDGIFAPKHLFMLGLNNSLKLGIQRRLRIADQRAAHGISRSDDELG